MSASFRAAALVRTAVKPVVVVGDLTGKTAHQFGSRMIEVNYRPEQGGWLEPELRDYGDLELRPQISALHYGLQVFDHCVVTRDKASKQPRVFRADCYLERLAKSRDYLHFAKYDNKDLMELVKIYVKEDADSIPTGPGQSLLVRTCIIGDNSSLSAGPADAFRMFMFGVPLDANTSSGNAPLKLKADPSVRRSWAGGTGGVSVGGNYANQIYHERQSRLAGFDKNLWLVDDEAIATAGDANFFAVFKSGNDKMDIVTPELGEFSMAGSMRSTVIELMQLNPNTVVRETKITMPEFAKAVKGGAAAEAFATSSHYITRPISAVWYKNELFHVPVPTEGVATRMKREILSIMDGTTAHPLSTLI